MGQASLSGSHPVGQASLPGSYPVGQASLPGSYPVGQASLSGSYQWARRPCLAATSGPGAVLLEKGRSLRYDNLHQFFHKEQQIECEN